MLDKSRLPKLNSLLGGSLIPLVRNVFEVSWPPRGDQTCQTPVMIKETPGHAKETAVCWGIHLSKFPRICVHLKSDALAPRENFVPQCGNSDR